MMDVQRAKIEAGTFEAFLVRVETRLRIALIATYGPVDGRVAALDALSWAWEHWEQVRSMENPVGYLFRVGQTSAKRVRVHPIPIDAATFREYGVAEINLELIPALGRLSAQQRTAVILVHAFGWSIRDVARMLDVAPSTIQTHLERALGRLRAQLEEHDEH